MEANRQEVVLSQTQNTLIAETHGILIGCFNRITVNRMLSIKDEQNVQHVSISNTNWEVIIN